MKTIQTVTLAAIVLVTVCSCHVKENKELRSAVDSLQTELQASAEIVQTLSDVGVLIDSIDLNRNLLNTHMIEGTSYANYTSRLNDINAYVKQTVRKIADLESSMKKSKTNNDYYASTIKKLKIDLEGSAAQLMALQLEVEKVRNENSQLLTTVRTREEELNKKEEMIQLNQQSIAALETRVDEIIRQSSMDQADAYYKQAQALETAAQRTKFAPRKKKATQKEALELYRLAATLGKEEAAPRIAMLEKDI